jgi:hypothetical protein
VIVDVYVVFLSLNEGFCSCGQPYFLRKIVDWLMGNASGSG